MSTQVVTAQFLMSSGEVVDMSSTLTDATSGELKTSGVVGAGGGIAATSLGTYANGKTIVGMVEPVSADGFITWAYINRRGAIAMALPIGVTEVTNQPFATNYQLQAGDTVQVLTETGAGPIRAACLNVITNQGTNAIFAVTPTGAASNNMTHILNGQGIGESLTGQTISTHWATSIESSLYAGGSVLYISDKGLPQGTCIVTNPNNLEVRSNGMGAPTINLNWQAQVITSA